MAFPQPDVPGTLHPGISSDLLSKGALGAPVAMSSSENGVASEDRQRTHLEYIMNQTSLLYQFPPRQSEVDPFSSQPAMIENFTSLSGMNSHSSQQPILNVLPSQPSVTSTLTCEPSDADSQSPAVFYAVVSHPSIADSSRSPLTDSLPSLPMTVNTLSSQSALTVQIAKDESVTDERIPMFKSIDGLVFYVPTSVAFVPESTNEKDSTVIPVEENVPISLEEKEGSSRYSPRSPKQTLSSRRHEREATFEADVFSEDRTIDGGTESLESRLAKRNALLPPRRRRRVAPKAIFGCWGCGKIFKSAASRSKHMAVCKRAKNKAVSEENADQARHMCPICHLDFPRALLLQDHMNFVHGKKRPISCPQCSKKFYRPHDLKIHLNIHFNIKNYVCDTCGRQFYHISNLKRHQRTHSGARPYACEHCLKRFTQVVSLRTHVKRHIKNGVPLTLPKNKSRCFYCQICGKTFKSKALRVAHETASHGPNDRVSCTACKQTFISANDLKNHTCTHRCNCKNMENAWNNKHETSDSSTVEDLDRPCSRTAPQQESSKRSEFQRIESCEESFSLDDPRRAEGASNLQFLESLEESSVSTISTNAPSVDTFVMYLSENGNHLSYVVKKESPIMGSESSNVQLQPDTIKINFSDGAQSEPSVNYATDANFNDTPRSTAENLSISHENTNCDFPTESIEVEVIDVETPADDVCFRDEVLVHTVISDISLDECQSPVSDVTDGVDYENSPTNSNAGLSLGPSASLRQPLSALSAHFCSQNSGVADPPTNICLKEMSENSHDVTTLALQKKSSASGLNDFRSIQFSSLMNDDCETFSFESSNAACEIADMLSDTGLQTSLLKFPEITQLASPRNRDSNVGAQKCDENTYISKAPKKCRTAPTNLFTSSEAGGDNPDRDTKDIPTSRGPFRCRVCSKPFNRKWNLEQHEGLHNPDQQRYRCPHCRRSFAYKTTYTAHLRSHNGAVRSVVCPVCSKEFKSKGAMAAHERRVHQKVKPHKCRLCERSFHQRAELAYHLRLHSKEQPYVCYTCGRTFAHSSNLLRHERQHSGEKPHRCSFCARGFIQAVGLKQHLKKHHLEEQRQQQGMENSDSEPIFVQSSKAIQAKPFQSQDQFSLKLPEYLPPKEATATPSSVYEDPTVPSNASLSNPDLPRFESLDPLSKTKLLNGDGNADGDAEPDMFAVIAGQVANTASALHEGDRSTLRSDTSAGQEAFNADIPDNMISNIGDVYGIIFMT